MPCGKEHMILCQMTKVTKQRGDLFKERGYKAFKFSRMLTCIQTLSMHCLEFVEFFEFFAMSARESGP